MEKSPVRLCECCQSPIPSMRGSRAKFCTSQCSHRQGAAKHRKGRDASLVLVHSCLSSEYDNFDARKCRCKLQLGDQKIEDLFKQNAARNLDPEHRQSVIWDRSDVLLVGKRVRTPRGASIERAHIFRGIQTFNLKQHRGKTPEQMKADLDDLRRRIAQEQLEKSEEEIFRWTAWALLQRECFAFLTREYSEVEWKRMEEVQKTLPSYVSGVGDDQRSTVGRNARSAEVSIDDTDDLEPQSIGDSNGIKETELPDSNTNLTNVVSFESLECLQAEIEDTEEMAA
jgi:hypothetical protein